MRSVAVIGKNYGDEGKGLVTASLCLLYNRPLVIKHNGGAQAGHTVEDEEKGIRFVHHQIGCGAEYGADTLFADSFHPDLYQIEKEIQEFEALFGFRPKLYAEAKTGITTVDDVLLNMAIETKRGDKRHGSCGMGINECVERIQAGYAITLDEVKNSTSKQLTERLIQVREEYTIPRAKNSGIDNTSTFWDMLNDSNVLHNFADALSQNISHVQIVNADETWLSKYDGLLFENGQGLLLDQDYEKNMPHVTASKTGVTEPMNFLLQRNRKLQEAIYVTRSYVTKHGAGPLSNEFDKNDFSSIQNDVTNEPNEWQGSIRYARHESVTDFMKPLLEDMKGLEIKPSLAVTHLNETNGKILFKNEAISIENLISKIDKQFQTIYTSWDRQSIRKMDTQHR